MKIYKYAVLYLALTNIFAVISISIQAPDIEAIEVEIQEAVYIRSVFEDGKAQVKVSITNNSPKPLKIKESTLTSHVIGYLLGKSTQGIVTIAPDTKLNIKFTIQEDWRYIPLYEPEWKQMYDFSIELFDFEGTRMGFKQIIPTPRTMIPQPFIESDSEQDEPNGIEFRVMNVTYPVDYLETAKKPPRHTDYTNVTVMYTIVNHDDVDVLLDQVNVSSNYGGYELGESTQNGKIWLPAGQVYNGSIEINEDWSDVRTIEFGMDFFYGFKTSVSRSFSNEDVFQLKQIYVEESIYPVLVDTNIRYLTRFSESIYNTGVPPDSIPPIEFPKFIGLDEVDFMNDNDIVYLMETEVPRVYPKRIMLWHEVVNDYIADKNISVTYCPLTESALGYSILFRGKTTTFGTSGKLLNSNLVLYDRETKSMWPQILGVSVEGKWKGVKLEYIPLLTTTWDRLKNVYPDAIVLSTETGTYRNYREDPYRSYISRGRIQFPVNHRDQRLDVHTKVIAVKHNNASMAIVKDHLRAEKVLSYELGGINFTAFYDEDLDAVRVSADDVNVTYFEVYWFSWVAYYPDTGLIGE